MPIPWMVSHPGQQSQGIRLEHSFKARQRRHYFKSHALTQAVQELVDKAFSCSGRKEYKLRNYVILNHPTY